MGEESAAERAVGAVRRVCDASWAIETSLWCLAEVRCAAVKALGWWLAYDPIGDQRDSGVCAMEVTTRRGGGSSKNESSE